MISLSSCDTNNGKLFSVTYNAKEMSYDTAPKDNSDISLLIAYTNIGFDSETMLANQIWGFSPRNSWNEKKIQIPNVKYNSDIKLNKEIEPGNWRIDKIKMWETFFNTETGWVCMGDYTSESNDAVIKFMKNAILVLNLQGEIKALWMQPAIV